MNSFLENVQAVCLLIAAGFVVILTFVWVTIVILLFNPFVWIFVILLIILSKM